MMEKNLCEKLLALINAADLETKEKYYLEIKDCCYLTNWIAYEVNTSNYYGLDEMIRVHETMDKEELKLFIESEVKKNLFGLSPEAFEGKRGMNVWKTALKCISLNVKQSKREFFTLKAKDLYPNLTPHNLKTYVGIRKATGYRASLSIHSNAEIMQMISENPKAPKDIKSLKVKALNTVRIAFNYLPEEENSTIENSKQQFDVSEIGKYVETIPRNDMVRHQKRAASPEDFLSVNNEIYLLKEALKNLTEKEQLVIMVRYGIGMKEKSLKEIGSVLGISAQRVSVIEARACVKMRNYMNYMMAV